MSGSKFGSSLVNELPRFEANKTFKKKLKVGRPAKGKHCGYWVK
jgi:hypothetical protein